MGSNVLILGNPVLREKSDEVIDFESAEMKNEMENLKRELERFRNDHGFGRGIAAIQIGIKKRMIALNIGSGTFCIINPEIIWQSPETFEMWDDCMSFPDLVVRVRRHISVSVRYFDENGRIQLFDHVPQNISELLQHEIDHLDGVLATDRAVARDAIIYKSEYKKHPALYTCGKDTPGDQ